MFGLGFQISKDTTYPLMQVSTQTQFNNRTSIMTFGALIKMEQQKESFMTS